MAVYSFPANPVPAELYQFLSGYTGPKWLPWYIWGGGVYSTKYGYDTTKFIGYLGTISVPIVGTATVTQFRLKGYASFKSGTQEGAFIIAKLMQRTNNVASPIATIYLDRRNITGTNGYFDIAVPANFTASSVNNSLAIELIGEGQGIATIYGAFVNM
jgi:hypothetical protein